jgi:tetratricopeptide (TPR) repeat protein
MSAGRGRRSRPGKLRYLAVSLSLIAAVAVCGWLLNAWLTQPVGMPMPPPAAGTVSERDFDELFAAAVEHMQRGEHQQALNLWHRLLLKNPRLPELQVNMGFTLFEMGHVDQARDFFTAAIESNSFQANAYYGLALVNEHIGDIELAMGAMRSYIHLAGSDADERFIRRARAALWEWEARLAEQRNRAGEETKPGSAAVQADSPD